MRHGRITWTPAQLAFVERHSKGARTELHAAYVEKFGRTDITLSAIASLCKRNGWNTDGAARNKGKSKVYSAAELKWLEQRKEQQRDELHAAFVKKFDRTDVSLSAFKAIFKNRRWTTGRTGHFVKGSEPPNKGKKMPEELKSNPAFTRNQFKKGSRGGVAADVYKPIGTERVHEGGYLERKIHDGLPMQSRWKFVHRIEWEKVHGPIPDDMRLKCLGGKLNTDPSNWELLPVGMLPRLNNQWGRNYDQAPAELKPTIMAVAKLEHRVREKIKGERR
jgi:hypothetical protein